MAWPSFCRSAGVFVSEEPSTQRLAQVIRTCDLRTIHGFDAQTSQFVEKHSPANAGHSDPGEAGEESPSEHKGLARFFVGRRGDLLGMTFVVCFPRVCKWMVGASSLSDLTADVHTP